MEYEDMLGRCILYSDTTICSDYFTFFSCFKELSFSKLGDIGSVLNLVKVRIRRVEIA